MKLWQTYLANCSAYYSIVAKFKTIEKARTIAKLIEKRGFENVSVAVTGKEVFVGGSCADYQEQYIIKDLLESKGAKIVKASLDTSEN